MKKFKINWIGMFCILASSLLCATIGISLPRIIAILNFGNIIYGTWASYVISILLFYLLTMDIKYVKEKK